MKSRLKVKSPQGPISIVLLPDLIPCVLKSVPLTNWRPGDKVLVGQYNPDSFSWLALKQ